MSTSVIVLTASVEVTAFAVAFLWLAYSDKRKRGGLAWTRLLLPASQVLVLVAAVWMHAGEVPLASIAVPAMATGAVCMGLDLFCLRILAKAERALRDDEYEAYLEQQALNMEHDLERLGRERASVVGFRDEVVEGLLSAREMVLRHEPASAVETYLSDVAGILNDTARISCSHPALNALLQVKNRRCEELGVAFMVAVDVPADVGIASTDLCGVFFNLIDNAINGCSGLSAGRRFVHVKARVERGFLVASVINSYAFEQVPEAKKPPERGTDDEPIRIFDDEPQPRSMPAPGDLMVQGVESPERLMREHGWGLQIVESIVERHNGMFSTEEREGIFEAAVTIPVQT